MSEKTDITRFVATVTKMADDEDNFSFIRERVKATTLYKLLSSRYDNIDDLLEKTLLKSTVYERMRTLMEREWKYAVHCRAYNVDNTRKAAFAVFYVETRRTLNPEISTLLDMFVQRHSRDALEAMASEIVAKYPSDGTLIGKFAEEFNTLKREEKDERPRRNLQRSR